MRVHPVLTDIEAPHAGPSKFPLPATHLSASLTLTLPGMGVHGLLRLLAEVAHRFDAQQW